MMNSIQGYSRLVAKEFLPAKARRWLRSHVSSDYTPPVGKVSFGNLRRTKPIGSDFGFSRGDAVDRHYIEAFLEENAMAVRGRVMEIAENTYTRKFGGDRVERSDVLHVREGEPGVTIVADLTQGDSIPSNLFDCIICTQTVHLLYRPREAIRTLHRILKPGGTVLVTVSGLGQICRHDMERWGDCWRYTDLSARRDFGDVFGEEAIEVRTYGNVLSAAAYLFCLAREELTKAELDVHDPDYQLIIGVRATKE